MLLYTLQVLRDSPKARREVAMHCRATGCKQIVQVKDVFENKVESNNCLLVVMEWYGCFFKFLNVQFLIDLR